jgi:hypothetical protein
MRELLPPGSEALPDMREGIQVMAEKKERDVIEEAKAVLNRDPVAKMLDDIAGHVLNAADRVEAIFGPMTEKEYAAVVALLADRAVMQMAMTRGRLAEHDCTGDDPARFCPDCKAGYDSVRESKECPVGCTCIFCVPGA